jgi:exodeoxyribonuclease VII small subunit
VTRAADKDKGPGFDEVLARLQAVVARLEQGNLSLEESLAAYEEGVGLARRGHTLLDSVEKRIELLAQGQDRVVPLDGMEDRGAAE